MFHQNMDGNIHTETNKGKGRRNIVGIYLQSVKWSNGVSRGLIFINHRLIK